jgi:hypothetical protein
MRYLPPALLFGSDFQPPFDARTIQRERKKWLAELELAGGEVIMVGGRSFTKNELIDYFDQLSQENIAAWHGAIAEDKVLLRFLQEGAINAGEQFKHGALAEGSAITESSALAKDPVAAEAPAVTKDSIIPEDLTLAESPALYTDPAFITWISPYFRQAFMILAKASFGNAEPSGMRAILDNKLFMTLDDQEQTWLFISGILEKNIHYFNHFQGRGQKTSTLPMIPIAQISAFIGHGYLEVIRQLPDSRFARLKDSYAHSMQHPAIAVFNRDERNRSLSIIWVEEALDLAVSATVKANLRSKLNELNGLLKKRKRKRLPVIFYLVFIGIGVLRALFEGTNSGKTIVPSDPTGIYAIPADSLHIDTTNAVIVRAHRKGAGKDSTRHN